MMADGYDDDVFVMENGIVTNQNIPLVLPHDLGENDDLEIDNEIPDLNANDQEIEELDENGNPQGISQEEPEGVQEIVNMAQNGSDISLHSISPALSAAPSSSVLFDQSEILGASSPAPNQAAWYVNEGYLSEESELSEYNASVEILADILTVSYKQSSLRSAGVVEEHNSNFRANVQSPFTSFSRNRERQLLEPSNSQAGPSSGLFGARQASSSRFDSSERFQPNPPNSPAVGRNPVSELRQPLPFPRSNRFLNNPRERLSNRPDRPYNLFLKFGSFLLLPVFIFLLAIVACLQGLLPKSYITVFLFLWILSFIGTVVCFLKACIEEEEMKSETATSRNSYGSTQTTNPGPSESA